MPGVVGGVSPRTLAQGQAPVLNPDLLSASTTLQQSGGGGFARLVDALQSLDQSANIVALLGSITTQAGEIATLQGQVATLQSQVTSINGQIGVINTQIGQLQSSVVTLTSEVGALQAQLGGWTFGAVGATVPSIAAGNVPATNAGTQYLLPLYSA